MAHTFFRHLVARPLESNLLKMEMGEEKTEEAELALEEKNKAYTLLSDACCGCTRDGYFLGQFGRYKLLSIISKKWLI